MGHCTLKALASQAQVDDLHVHNDVAAHTHGQQRGLSDTFNVWHEAIIANWIEYLLLLQSIPACEIAVMSSRNLLHADVKMEDGQPELNAQLACCWPTSITFRSTSKRWLVQSLCKPVTFCCP